MPTLLRSSARLIGAAGMLALLPLTQVGAQNAVTSFNGPLSYSFGNSSISWGWLFRANATSQVGALGTFIPNIVIAADGSWVNPSPSTPITQLIEVGLFNAASTTPAVSVFVNSNSSYVDFGDGGRFYYANLATPFTLASDAEYRVLAASAEACCRYIPLLFMSEHFDVDSRVSLIETGRAHEEGSPAPHDGVGYSGDWVATPSTSTRMGGSFMFAGDASPGVVPEPGSIALLATGLAGLGAIVARRRRR